MDICVKRLNMLLGFDAAYVHTKGLAMMPTPKQCQELLDETIHTYVENYNESGINGMKFVSKKDSSKYIFIPASDNISNNKFHYNNEIGITWSNSMDRTFVKNAIYLYFDCDNNCGVDDYFNRAEGLCIRSVKNKD